MKYLDKDGLTYLWGKIKAKIPTKTSELTNDSGFTTFSGNYNDLTNKPTIPAQLSAGSHIDITNNTIKNTGVWSVTESASSAANGTIQVVTGTSGGDSTVNVGVKGLNNAAYKNVDTTISSSAGTNLPTSTAVKNFVEGKGYITSYTESDPIFSASAASGISSSDITNWNGKTSNIGTITGINMNGSSKGTSGVVDLGTVLTSHQSIKTINSNTITGTGNVSVGTITKVQANGTDVASSGTANIPAASTSAYGVTKLSNSTSSTSTSLAATASAVKSAYDRASTALTTANSKVGAWNYLGVIVPGVTASVTLPSSFNEILCVVEVDNNTTVQLTIVIPNDRLSSTAVGFRSGYYRSANVNAYARVDVTTTTVTLNEVYLNGQAKTSNSSVFVYYR